MAHFCPVCGSEHDEPVVLEAPTSPCSEDEQRPGGDELAEHAINAVRDVALAAVQADAVSDVAQAEADSVEAQAQAVEEVAEAAADVAEEHSEEAIASDQEPEDDEEPEDEEAGPDEEADEEAHAAEPTPVSVPPQEDEPLGARGRPGRGPVSRFRARRG